MTFVILAASLAHLATAAPVGGDTLRARSATARVWLAPDGKSVTAMSDMPGALQRFALPSGAPKEKIPLPCADRNVYRAIDLSPDGRWLAVSCGTGDVRVVAVDDEAGGFSIPVRGVGRLVWSVDSSVLALQSHRQVVWYDTTGVRLGERATSGSSMHAVGRGMRWVFATDSLMPGTPRELWVVDLATEREARIPLPGFVRDIALDADGSRVLVARDNSVVAVDLAAGEVRWGAAARVRTEFSSLAVLGDRVLVAGEDGVRTFDLADGSELAPWSDLPVSELVVSSDGRRVAGAGSPIVRVWSADGRVIDPGPGLTSRPDHLGISDGGRSTAAIAADGSVLVARGRRVVQLPPGDGLTLYLALSADGRWLAIARGRGMYTPNVRNEIEIHDLRDDTTRSIEMGDQYPGPLVFTPGGTLVALLWHPTDSTDIVRFDPQTGAERGRAPTTLSRAEHVAIDPTGALLVVWSLAEPILVVDIASGVTVRHGVPAFSDPPIGAGFDDAGRMVLAAVDERELPTVADDSRFHVWSPPDGPGSAWALGDSRPLALSPDGRLVAAASHELLTVWSTATRAVVGTEPLVAPVAGAVFSRSGSLLLGYEDGRLELVPVDVDVASPVCRPVRATDVGRLVGLRLPFDAPLREAPPLPVELPSALYYPRWRPGTGDLVGFSEGQLYLISTRLSSVRVRDWGRGVPRWSPDGARVAWAGRGELHVEDFEGAGEPTTSAGVDWLIDWTEAGLLVKATDGAFEVRGADGAVKVRLDGAAQGCGREAASHPAGGRVVSWGARACVWDVGTGAVVGELGGHAGAWVHAAWSPDGATIVSSGLEGAVLVWNAQDLSPAWQLSGHGRVTEMAFSPDGSQVAMPLGDGEITMWEHDDGVAPPGEVVIWDLETGRALERLPVGGSRPQLAWSANGLAIATDGAVLVWE